jgi:hypothetical protein
VVLTWYAGQGNLTKKNSSPLETRMSLNPQEFTDKTNNMIQKARELAAEGSNPQMEPLHLALAMFQV